MTDKINNIIIIRKLFLPAFLVGLVIIVLLLFAVRSSPNLTICGVKAGFKTTTELREIVTEYLALNYPQSIQVVYRDQKIPLIINRLKYSPEDTVFMLKNRGKTKIGPLYVPSVLVTNKVVYQPLVNLEEITQLIATISASFEKPAIEPEILLQTGIEIKTAMISEGQIGSEVDRNKLVTDLELALACPKSVVSIMATLHPTGTVLSENQKQQTLSRANSLIGKNIKLILETNDWDIKDDQLISFLGFNGSYNHDSLNIYTGEISELVGREPENASFQFENNRVTLFRPAKDGLKLDSDTFVKEIVNSLILLESSQEKTTELIVPVTKTPPLVSNQEANNLGINELVGQGTSLYFGSIAGRVHNLTLASEKLNGILIAPGEEFSFNKALGEISAKTGYQPAYIIQNGRTVLGDGGGVCQTSTTMFRVILNAGLPITERHAHAYRVHYYEDDLGPGYDATVFSPSVDLKFVNDTPSYLLLQTKVDKTKLQLTYELYGTNDGRKSEISKARVWARIPAPPALYQDDPTLKVGVVKQIDWAAAGAKTAFDYKVTRNGETLQEKTYSSNYRPWQAIYLRGTKTN